MTQTTGCWNPGRNECVQHWSIRRETAEMNRSSVLVTLFLVLLLTTPGHSLGIGGMLFTCVPLCLYSVYLHFRRSVLPICNFLANIIQTADYKRNEHQSSYNFFFRLKNATKFNIVCGLFHFLQEWNMCGCLN